MGRATSLALAARGAFVWVTDFDLAGADRTDQLIEETGGRARSFRLDVRLEDAWQEGLALTDSHEDDLTVLVNYAGKSIIAHKIGRAHVLTPVPNAHLVCRILILKI